MTAQNTYDFVHDIHFKTPLISPSELFLHHLFSSEFFYFFKTLCHLKTQELWNDVRQEKPFLKSLSVTESFHSASYCSFTPVFSLSPRAVCLSELCFSTQFDSLWLFLLSFSLAAVIQTGTFGITTTAVLCSSAGAPIHPRSSSSTCPPTPLMETLASRPSESW